MMLSTGIPELREAEDIYYLRDALRLDLNEQDAAEHFKKLIHKALNTLSTQVNDMVHMMIH